MSNRTTAGIQTITTTPLIQRPEFLEGNEERKTENITVVKLKPKPKKSVKWTEDTIDNENLNRLKSNSKTFD